MTIEHDGYVTVYPTLDGADHVQANIAESVEGMIEAGYQPMSVRVNVAAYRALLARNGLERRNVREVDAKSLRVRAHGFDLPVDADVRVPPDDAWCISRETDTGRA
jgi:hypothetical protein